MVARDTGAAKEEDAPDPQMLIAPPDPVVVLPLSSDFEMESSPSIAAIAPPVLELFVAKSV